MNMFSDFTKVHLHSGEQIFALIYFGELKACKTETEAREAAEILKNYLEAKAAGKVARLVVEEKCTCGPYQVCGKKCNHPDYQRPKNAVIDLMNDGPKTAKQERHEAFQVAHMAALIFAHNTHNFDERRAVQSAAKILDYAKQKSE